MSGIDAPYNFVPLSGFVFSPTWHTHVSHDIPFRDGVSGVLSFTLKARSPLLVGRDKKKADRHVRFFQLPDGQHAIPSSSLTGMIRNVIEIAAFGKFSAVDDTHLGVRDLSNAAKRYYRDRIQEVRAGWLRLHRGRWSLTPCACARVAHGELMSISGSAIDWSAKASARDRYNTWPDSCSSLAQSMWAPPRGDNPAVGASPDARFSSFSGALPTATPGVLVFTGHTGARGATEKQKEFFFYDSAVVSMDVDASVMTGFMAVHKDAQDSSKDNEEWSYWKPMAEAGQAVPVFWLEEAGKVSRVGLAMMFKLAYDYSIHEMIAHTAKAHLNNTRFDLPELMFGRAAAHRRGDPPGLKGRVSFSTATEIPPRQAVKCTGETVLLAPKPNYFPAYVRQAADPTDPLQLARIGPAYTYATYMNVKPSSGEVLPIEVASPELRGWKRYPARKFPPGSVNVPPPPPQAGPDVRTTLHPLPEGAVFRGKVRFHNLRPAELGALLWATEWDGNEELRHSLGMGKPFGFGQVTIAMDEITTQMVIPNDPAGALKTKAEYRAAFVDVMARAYKAESKEKGTWAESEQMVQLLAMAEEVPHDPLFTGKLKHMPLARFAAAKKDNLILPEYARFVGVRDHKLFPRSYTFGPSIAGRTSAPLPPASRWLNIFVERRANGDRRSAVQSPVLAALWSRIDDPSLKAAVREEIFMTWEEMGLLDPMPPEIARLKEIYSSG